MMMNKQLEIFVKCFYVCTKITLRTLSLAFFSKSHWIFIFKYRTGLAVEKISARSSVMILLKSAGAQGLQGSQGLPFATAQIPPGVLVNY